MEKKWKKESILWINRKETKICIVYFRLETNNFYFVSNEERAVSERQHDENRVRNRLLLIMFIDYNNKRWTKCQCYFEYFIWFIYIEYELWRMRAENGHIFCINHLNVEMNVKWRKCALAVLNVILIVTLIGKNVEKKLES